MTETTPNSLAALLKPPIGEAEVLSMETGPPPDLLDLLALAQGGQAAQARTEVEAILAALPDGADPALRAALLHVLVEALADLKLDAESLERAEEYVALARDLDQAGWLAAACAMRGWRHARLGNGEEALADLVTAEIALDTCTDALLELFARQALGWGYWLLRLYELALPHLETAVDLPGGHPIPLPEAVARDRIWLSTFELAWSAELFRVGDDEGTRRHLDRAGLHAELALREAEGLASPLWTCWAQLLLACSRLRAAGAEETVPALASALEAAAALGLTDQVAYGTAAMALALHESGHHEEGLELASRAIELLGGQGQWATTVAVEHARVSIGAAQGVPGAEWAMSYAQHLESALWDQRLRMLRGAEAMLAYERLRERHDRAQQAALEDPLTGLANRRRFDQVMRHRVKATDEPQPFSLILIDIDRFKSINDRLGHNAGDVVLRRIAETCADHARAQDLVVRFGGDEFVVLLDGAEAATAQSVADRLLEALDHLSWNDVDRGLRVTTSVGTATGMTGEAAADLLHAADTAMYTAKRAGGNRVMRAR